MLGGIVHRGSPRPIDLVELHAALLLQPSVKEIKLKHLGAGGFLKLLASPKIETFLEWLTSREFLLHYQVTDLLYWSIVDIVDSIVTEVSEPALMVAHLLLNDSLYTVLRADIDGTAELLGRYNSTDVGSERRSAFIAELRDLVEHHEPLSEHSRFYMLKGLLQAAKG